jgi:molecular chaperone Hsp33
MTTQPDALIHAVDHACGLSAQIAVTTAVCQEAEVRHFAGRIAAQSMARVITGTVLLSSTLKDGEKQSVQVSTSGPMRTVHAEADSTGNVRARAVPVAAPELDLSAGTEAAAFGGLATVSALRSLDGKLIYSGSVEVERPTARSCFAEYLARSEQTEAAIELCAQYAGGGISHAAGVTVRLLPGGDADAFAKVRERFAAGEVFELLSAMGPAAQVAGRPVSSRRRAVGAVGAVSAEPPQPAPEPLTEMVVLAALGFGADADVSRPRLLRFHCPCSKHRVIGMLAALGADEVRDILATEGSTEVGCAFCNATYEISGDDLRGLLERMKKGGPD